MPTKTTWSCDNPKCSNKHLKPRTKIPRGWRTMRIMTTGLRLDGQEGVLCGGCVKLIAAMLPPPHEQPELEELLESEEGTD